MDRSRRIAAVAAGAIVAGVASGTATVVLPAHLGLPVGLGLAMPLLTTGGWGGSGFDDPRYRTERSRRGRLADALLVTVAAMALGVGTAIAAATVLDGGLLAGVAAGATFLGGGLAHAWRSIAWRRDGAAALVGQ